MRGYRKADDEWERQSVGWRVDFSFDIMSGASSNDIIGTQNDGKEKGD